MNKNKWYSLLLSIFFMAVTAVVVRATTTTIEFSAELVIPPFFEATIDHTAITNVSATDRKLNAKVEVMFGDYVKAEQAELLYYYGEDSSNVQTQVYTGSVNHKSPFYIALDNIPSDATKVSYQIKVTFEKPETSEDALCVAYWPTQTTVSSDTFNVATIAKSTSTTIGSEGGSVELEDGDQSTGNTEIVVDPGVLPPGTIIEIEEGDLDSGDFDAPSLNGVKKSSPCGTRLKGYNFKATLTDGTVVDELETPVLAKFSYGAETSATKFEVRWRKDKNTPWEDAEIIKIVKVDTIERLVHCYVTKTGQYMIFEALNVSDSEYKPAKRTRVKSRIANGTYAGFEFKNLKEGDVVNIYAVNGKKIRKIDSGTGAGFIWDGRKDNGDWAESGTYIYQIKLKEKGKVISGTIAFVW